MNCLYIAYLFIIFAALKTLNLKMQKCSYDIIDFHSCIDAFKTELNIWCLSLHSISY